MSKKMISGLGNMTWEGRLEKLGLFSLEKSEQGFEYSHQIPERLLQKGWR